MKEFYVWFGAYWLLVGICIGIAYYKAGVQKEVWDREGVHLSQWEVMMGAHPMERVNK